MILDSHGWHAGFNSAIVNDVYALDECRGPILGDKTLQLIEKEHKPYDKIDCFQCATHISGPGRIYIVETSNPPDEISVGSDWNCPEPWDSDGERLLTKFVDRGFVDKFFLDLFLLGQLDWQ